MCDLSGNIREWTLDVAKNDNRGIHNDARPWGGAATLEQIFTTRVSSLRMTRGGSWAERAKSMTSTNRRPIHMNASNHLVGIRLVGSLCGNGLQDPGEQCDDGNHDEYDGCDFLCQEN